VDNNNKDSKAYVLRLYVYSLKMVAQEHGRSRMAATEFIPMVCLVILSTSDPQLSSTNAAVAAD
jgi:hypothetical protein